MASDPHQHGSASSPADLRAVDKDGGDPPRTPLPERIPKPAPKPKQGKKAGRKPKKDRSAVFTKKVDFAVTEQEKKQLRIWAREDGCSSLSEWLREQVGLPGKKERSE